MTCELNTQPTTEPTGLNYWTYREDARRSFLEAQGGLCALCLEAIPADTAVLDHDHRTQFARGALCRRCNLALGWYEGTDDAWRQRAAGYVARGGRGSG